MSTDIFDRPMFGSPGQSELIDKTIDIQKIGGYAKVN